MQHSEPDADGFVTVKKRGRGRAGRAAAHAPVTGEGGSGGAGGGSSSAAASTDAAGPLSRKARRAARGRPEVSSTEAIIRRVQDKAASVDGSTFVERLLAAVTATSSDGKIKRDADSGEVEHIVCYGIGSLSEAANAATQMRCLLRLNDSLGCAGAPEVYDPIMTDVRTACRMLSPRAVVLTRAPRQDERAAAVALGARVVEQNEGCSRRVLRRTLFFMPHCGVSMYANLLRANWGEQLSNVIVVGNSFAAYIEASELQPPPRDRSSPDVQVLCAAAAVGTEVPIPPGDLFHAFNNTSLHWFPSGKLAELGGLPDVDGSTAAPDRDFIAPE